MGVDPVTAGIVAGTIGLGANESRKARKSAERSAAADREALAALQTDGSTPLDKPAMPTATGSEVKKAERKSITEQLRRRRGRESTILTSAESSGALGA